MLISIVYDSGHGHTRRLADAVADGVRRVPEAQVRLISVADGVTDWDLLQASDAIVFGSPTYNAAASARFKQFMEDATRPAWLGLKWRDKVAAGFTNSGAQNGDKLSTLLSMALFAAQHGMLWVGLDLMSDTDVSKTSRDLNRLGSWLGAMAQSDDAAPEVTPPRSDLLTAAYLGERVVRTALRMHARTA